MDDRSQKVNYGLSVLSLRRVRRVVAFKTRAEKQGTLQSQVEQGTFDWQRKFVKSGI